MTAAKRLFVITLIPLVAILAWDLIRFDRQLWLDDYARLKQGLAQGYANLDWQVDERDQDLAAIDAETSARLEGAFSHFQAWLAMRDFIGRFDDPHLQLKFGAADPSERMLPEQSAVNAEWIDCTANGFKSDDFTTSLAYPRAAGWMALAPGNFPAGTIGEIGIVRIAEFGEQKYRGDCNDNPMDARELQLATRAHLNREFVDILAQLKEAGATRLVIDVTGNGGGSEWSSEMAAMLSTGTIRRRAPLLADPRCDRSSVWQGARPCSIYGPAREDEQREGAGLWDGPMALLIDRNSASATEEFAVWLQDNDQAVLVGETTLGAGCGYISGGNAVQFNAVSLHVIMPNCTRLTRDGRNEMEGIAPDIEADWAEMGAEGFDSLFQRIFAD